MWGGPPFCVSDNVAVDVRNLSDARNWYKEKLLLREANTDREEDSGRPFVDLWVSKGGASVSLVELPPGTSPGTRRVILYAKNLKKTHEWFESRGVIVEPITADSAGNRFFRFTDLDGNRIEVCVEP